MFVLIFSIIIGTSTNSLLVYNLSILLLLLLLYISNDNIQEDSFRLIQ